MSNADPVDSDTLSTEARRVLGGINGQTNPVQGQWVTESQLKQLLAAYGPLSPEDVEDGLDELERQGLVQMDTQGYRQAPGVGRPKHPGEV